jgi:shikimate dehydrogenase
MHEQEALAHSLRFVYRPIDLLELNRPATDVGELLAAGMALGFNAFNITHPCKQLVLEYLDDIDPAAQRLGACNTVLIQDGRLIGYNTDRSGFASALALELPEANLDDVVLLGAGGAGSALADALVGAGVQRLSIIDPQPERGEALAAQLQDAKHADGSIEIRIGNSDDAHRWIPSATGLVNASPIGMFSHPGLPVDPQVLHAGLWVADIVYRPAITELITHATNLGCSVMPGKAMAVGQAADTFELVTGIVPDRARMYVHLNELVDLEEQG